MRATKSEKYEKEQKEILNKLLKILNINDDNNILILNNFEKDNMNICKILELSNDVRTYFNINNWSYFQKYDKKENKEYILLVRGILKALKVEYYMSSLKIKEDGKWINTRKYVIKI
jgi:glycerophosphoryl diester phosphodiesterase